jgi:hypothetical protein
VRELIPWALIPRLAVDSQWMGELPHQVQVQMPTEMSYLELTLLWLGWVVLAEALEKVVVKAEAMRMAMNLLVWQWTLRSLLMAK